jgi:hypothetical protein
MRTIRTRVRRSLRNPRPILVTLLDFITGFDRPNFLTVPIASKPIPNQITGASASLAIAPADGSSSDRPQTIEELVKN